MEVDKKKGRGEEPVKGPSKEKVPHADDWGSFVIKEDPKVAQKKQTGKKPNEKVSVSLSAFESMLECRFKSSSNPGPQVRTSQWELIQKSKKTSSVTVEPKTLQTKEEKELWRSLSLIPMHLSPTKETQMKLKAIAAIPTKAKVLGELKQVRRVRVRPLEIWKT